MLNIYKKIKVRERLVIIIKLINKDLDKENNFDEEILRIIYLKLLSFSSIKNCYLTA